MYDHVYNLNRTYADLLDMGILQSRQQSQSQSQLQLQSQSQSQSQLTPIDASSCPVSPPVTPPRVSEHRTISLILDPNPASFTINRTPAADTLVGSQVEPEAEPEAVPEAEPESHTPTPTPQPEPNDLTRLEE